MKIKIYQAVCSNPQEKCWWTVNGGWCDSYDEAVRIANRHVGISKLGGKIERVDEDEVDSDDFYSPRSY